jgi:signal recognition particle receptor subunit beta
MRENYMKIRAAIFDYRSTKDPTIIGIVEHAFHLEGADGTLWDMAGQSRFSSLWERVIAEQHLGIIVVDDALENALRSKRLVSLVRDTAPYVSLTIIVITSRQDPLGVEALKNIFDVPIHFLNFTESNFDSKLIKIIQKLIQDGSKTRIPKAKPIKQLKIDKHLLLEFLRINLRKKLIIEGDIESILNDIEQGSESTLLRVKDILSGPEIPNHVVEWILLKCQELFQNDLPE